MKVLIIKQGALGDIIMSTPVIARLLEHHADDEVLLLTSPAYSYLFNHWSRLIVQTCPRKGVTAMWQTLRWIRGQKFQRLYDLQSNDRSGVLCALAGVPERAGNHPRFPYTHHPRDPYHGQCHAFDRLNEILVSAGVTAAPVSPGLPVTDAVKTRVRAWLMENNLPDKKIVILHGGGSSKHPGKRWPYYPELAQALHKLGFIIVWTGGPDDAILNRALAEQTGIDTTGMFDVAETIELGRHAEFTVANDSAPMHILSCSGIPVYGLFGPTDWRRNHALGHQSRVITLDHFKNRALCDSASKNLANLPVSMVLDKLRQDGML